MRILISGASVAGPALAFWLHRAGHAVTVVEKAPHVRDGGYPIDIRGSAIDVVDRMGLLPQIRAADIATERISMVDGAGRVVGKLEARGEGGAGDVELPRGSLTAVLYDAVRNDVEFRFGDSIATLTDDGEVTFASGRTGTYDVVAGADGLHSHTRRLLLGPEEPFTRYLGFCFAGFTLPNDFGLAREGVVHNAPGRMAALYAAGDSPTLHGLLAMARPQPPLAEFGDVEAQRELVAGAFAGDGWQVPRMIDALRTADDVFFDVVSQVRLPGWSRGRVVLVGDAAYAPSFLSGQGTSCALVGAYVLGQELASGKDARAAFAAYETRLRPFVKLNQALADNAGPTLAPRTRRGIWLRNQMLHLAPLIGRTGLLGRSGRRAANAVTL